jgi:hypothetical protein
MLSYTVLIVIIIKNKGKERKKDKVHDYYYYCCCFSCDSRIWDDNAAAGADDLSFIVFNPRIVF